MFDNEENFRNIVGGSFGQIEAQVGPEAYGTHIDVQKSIAEFNRAQVEVMKAQIEQSREQTRIGVRYSEAQIAAYEARVRFLGVLSSAVAFAALIGILGFLVPFAVSFWIGVF